MNKHHLPLLLAFILLIPLGLIAQKDAIPVPRRSPAATVTQTIGFTDITISYHRPAAKGRVIWGNLVPYEQVWRAGANEITSISFKHEVRVEGKLLPAGTYGLHILPHKEGAWEVIFSSNATDWGSYNYREEEDMQRISVTPTTGNPFQEWMSFSFGELGKEGATVDMKWGELKLSFKLSIEVDKHILAQFRKDLRTHAFFSWQGFYQAARYCFNEGINEEEAMQWLETSISREANYSNLMLRSQQMEKKGMTEEAKSDYERAISLASSKEIYYLSRRLLGGENPNIDQAIEISEKAIDRDPEGWWAYFGLATAYQKKGETAKAKEFFEKTLSKVSPDYKYRVEAQYATLK